jgi:hypothetical protein
MAVTRTREPADQARLSVTNIGYRPDVRWKAPFSGTDRQAFPSGSSNRIHKGRSELSLSAGKIKHMKASFNDAGVIAAAAMDQPRTKGGAEWQAC